jgi:hypothetical protein
MWILEGDHERELTLRCMQRWGVDNVRGASWVRDRPIEEPAELWLRSMDDENNHWKEKPTATMSVSTIANTNISSWTISGPLKNKHNAIEFHICHKGTKAHPRVQPTSNKLPMRCPFGITQYLGQGSFSINYSIAPYMDDVTAFFKAADKWILDWAWENRQQVFPGKAPSSREIMDSMYTPMLTAAKGDYDDLIRTKVGMNVPVWIVSDKGTVKGSTQDVVAHSNCCPVLSFDKVWYNSNRFGVTVRTQAILCQPKLEQTLDDLFIQDPMDT